MNGVKTDMVELATYTRELAAATDRVSREKDPKRKYAADGVILWLKGFRETLEWIEMFVGGMTDARLAIYCDPKIPGTFDNGVTQADIAEAIKNLERVRDITYKGKP